MPHLLAYRVGSVKKPPVPLARLAEMGIQGLELVWEEQTTVQEVSAALKPSGLRITSIGTQHEPRPHSRGAALCID